MRIGFYGMPAAGKSYVLDLIDFMETAAGSSLLREYDPYFDIRDQSGRERARKAVARRLTEKKTFIMDGHYAFGDETAFTEDDGDLYDVFLYLYVSPGLLKERMAVSGKNRKYLRFDIEEWQNREISGLRAYCHENNKDFYVLDDPPGNRFEDVSSILKFIRDIVNGYSCASYARECADDIIRKSRSDTILLLDGDKTLTTEDTSKAVFGYKTCLYDGNFYTGYQSWKQDREFGKYIFPDITEMPVHFNEKVKNALTDDSFILTSGHEKVWSFLSQRLGIGFYCGKEMSAETKLFVTKHLQEAGKYVIAYGDGLNDYFMLKQADEGYLVTRKDGSFNRSLRGRNMEGLGIV